MNTAVISHATRQKLFFRAPLALLLVLGALANSAHGPSHGGVVRPLAGAQFTADEDVRCLSDVLENGDPATGPSTFLLRALPKCVVPAHFHTADEQLVVVRGQVSTGMDGMSDTVLGPGGFAMIAG